MRAIFILVLLVVFGQAIGKLWEFLHEYWATLAMCTALYFCILAVGKKYFACISRTSYTTVQIIYVVIVGLVISMLLSFSGCGYSAFLIVIFSIAFALGISLGEERNKETNV